MTLHSPGMPPFRTYGQPPWTVAVLHGGPGARDIWRRSARELSAQWGVLEPLLSADSVDGQIGEVQAALRDACPRLPITLVGSSWGAVLGLMLTARCPDLVRKLVMVGSAVYEEQYADGIQDQRFGRLTPTEQREVCTLAKAVGNAKGAAKNEPFARLAALFARVDAYDPLTLDLEVVEHQHRVFQGVWKDVLELRREGRLLDLARQIRCPVVAIHGDYDPHPADGVEKPLTAAVADFRFHLLPRCGHLPWIERQAKDEFYAILRRELGGANQPIDNRNSGRKCSHE